MALQLEDKKAIVAEVAQVAARASSAVIAEYRGLTVAQMTALRNQARKSGVYVRVVRNTLARLAFENTEFSCLQDALKGPLLFCFSEESPGSAARLVHEFSKEHEFLVAKAIGIGGQMLPASALKQVSSLPTKDEAISQLMSVMKAPIEKFVRTLVAPHTKLVRTVEAVRAQKAA